jgi:hypothetical protein
MRIPIIITFLILLISTSVAIADGLVNVPSAFSVEETANRLESILNEKVMTVYKKNLLMEVDAGVVN